MSLSTTGPSRITSPQQIYSEVEDQFAEATEADLDEYARRIGLDPVQDKHLFYLANEGLMQRLPTNWKPCFEPHRKAWYYYNHETLKSQWEHPLDAVYRQKVAQARTEHAMNRIQTFDLSAPRTLKSLPPLRTGGGGLKPLMPLQPIQSGETNLPFSEPSGAPRNKLQPLPTQLKKSSGLVVTGGGSSFLKSSSQKPENSIQSHSQMDNNESPQFSAQERPGQKIIIPSAVPLGSPQSSLKGILANSMSRTPFDQHISSLTNWDPNPGFMTAEEKKLWKTLEDGEMKRRKGSVKFSLDEDPEIHFEHSSQSEKILKQDETETGTSTANSNTEEDEESKSLSLRQEKVEREYKPLVPKNSATNVASRPNTGQISLPEPKPNVTSKPIASQIGAGEKSSEKDIHEFDKVAREEMRAQMEEQLKVYQDELEKERMQREEQMKKHMEQVLEETRLQNDDTIKRFKANIEKQGQSELDKSRRAMDALLIQELKKIREETEEQIRIGREKMTKEQENVLKDVEFELSQIDREAAIKERRKQTLADIETALQEELKGVKEALREDQKRQTQQIKDNHASYLYKLKGEFKAEEDNVRREQTMLLAEIVATQKKENDDILTSFKLSQESELSHLKSEYGRKKQALELRLHDSSNSIVKPGKTDSLSETQSHRTKNSKTVQKTDALEMKENELILVKAEYDALHKKYIALKQSLGKVVTEERSRMKQQHNDDNMNASFVELNTGIGDSLSSSQSEDAATSQDITASDSKKVNHKKDNQQSSRIKQIRDDSEDRVNKALSALETLRAQIMEIKSEQDLQAAQEKDMSSVNPNAVNEKRGSRKSSNNVFATARRSSETIRQPGAKIERPRIKASRSATDINSLRVAEEGEMSEDESRHQVVEEAKDFIKSQKRRLSRNIPGFGLRSPISSNPGLNQKHIKGSLTNLQRRKDYIYSETESSGLGSLKSLPSSKDRAQVSKDIDSILLSLQKLDKQMKYLWSVVGKQRPNPNISSFDPQLSQSRLAKGNPAPALLAPLVHPVSPPALAQLSRLVESQVDYPLSNQSSGFSTTNELTSRYSLGPTFFNVANSNLMSNLSRMSQTNFNLDEHVNNLRNTQARVSQLPNDEMSASLREKTKDLREWLEKF